MEEHMEFVWEGVTYFVDKRTWERGVEWSATMRRKDSPDHQTVDISSTSRYGMNPTPRINWGAYGSSSPEDAEKYGMMLLAAAAWTRQQTA